MHFLLNIIGKKKKKSKQQTRINPLINPERIVKNSLNLYFYGNILLEHWTILLQTIVFLKKIAYFSFEIFIFTEILLCTHKVVVNAGKKFNKRNFFTSSSSNMN